MGIGVPEPAIDLIPINWQQSPISHWANGLRQDEEPYRGLGRWWLYPQAKHATRTGLASQAEWGLGPTFMQQLELNLTLAATSRAAVDSGK